MLLRVYIQEQILQILFKFAFRLYKSDIMQKTRLAIRISIGFTLRMTTLGQHLKLPDHYSGLVVDKSGKSISGV